MLREFPQALRHPDLGRRLRASWAASPPCATRSRSRSACDEAYLNGPTVHNPAGSIPNDPEIPLLLNKVYPAHEVVKIDYYLPGCPPSADTIWEALVALLDGKPLELPYELIKYD